MERSVLQHLTPDEIDLVLEGTYPEPLRTHVNGCPDCSSLLPGREARGAVAGGASAARARGRFRGPGHGTGAGCNAPHRRSRPCVTAHSRHRRRVALAAGAVISVLGSLAASVIWSLGHREVLASLGMTAFRSIAELGWVVVHGLATTIVEQPWYGSARALVDSPARLATVTGAWRRRGPRECC